MVGVRKWFESGLYFGGGSGGGCGRVGWLNRARAYTPGRKGGNFKPVKAEVGALGLTGGVTDVEGVRNKVVRARAGASGKTEGGGGRGDSRVVIARAGASGRTEGGGDSRVANVCKGCTDVAIVRAI